MGLPLPLRVPIGAFFQGNRWLVPKLFDRVGELVQRYRPARVVDLYGGVGFLAASAQFAGVDEADVVEENEVAAAAAHANLPECRVRAMPCESYLAAPAPGAGAMAIVDPPRAGLTAAARAALVEWSPSFVAVLSCDPARFGRDGAALLAAGYHLEQLEIWDLFAGSHHAEILAVFTRT